MTNAYEHPRDDSFEQIALEASRDQVERAIRIGNGADPRARTCAVEAARELGRAFGFKINEGPL